MLNITPSDIAKARDKNIWGFANGILYDMCKNHPKHDDEAVIIGKVWIIGRAYSAAVERGAKVPKEDIGNVYEKHVAPQIKHIGALLDEKIEVANRYSRITRDSLPQILRTHKFLTDTFKDAVGLSKRSLASKYLHFHAPNSFYIYDSIACTNICACKLQSRSLKEELMHEVGEGNHDESYLDFAAKAFTLSRLIFDDFGEWLSPRELDALLLRY